MSNSLISAYSSRELEPGLSLSNVEIQKLDTPYIENEEIQIDPMHYQTVEIEHENKSETDINQTEYSAKPNKSSSSKENLKSKGSHKIGKILKSASTMFLKAARRQSDVSSNSKNRYVFLDMEFHNYTYIVSEQTPYNCERNNVRKKEGLIFDDENCHH